YPFGEYELLDELSRGGMAQVHYAIKRRDPQRKLFALKTILPQYASDSNFRRFFSAEIDLTRALNHPNIVRVTDWGDVDGQPYFAMEYIHGRSLNRILQNFAQQGKRLPVPHATYVAIQALEGLEHAHQATDAQGRPLHIVMCDISTSNLMVGYS